MIYIALNIVQIAVATAAGLAFGFTWYALAGRSLPAARAPGTVAAAGVAEFWLAAILAGALILAPSGKAAATTMALGSAVVIWIGFVVPALVVTLRARGVTWRGVAFDVAHWLGVMLVQAVVLHALGLTPPPA